MLSLRTRSVLLLAATALGLGAATASADAVPAGAEHVGFPLFSDTVRTDALYGAVGDVDGDGLQDSAVSVPVTNSLERIWVTYAASALPSGVEAGGPGWRGFAIDDPDTTGMALAGLPDVNGDGLGEVVVRGWNQTYVVFGRADGATVDLAHLGAAGFTIQWTGHIGIDAGDGTTSEGLVEWSAGVQSAGDQNGDGRADLAIGHGGGLIVVATPASPAGATVDLTDPASVVFQLRVGHAMSGTQVDDLGDVNGDGRRDFMLAWDDAQGATHVAGVVSPPPGTDESVSEAVDDAEAFAIDGPGSLEAAIAVGDQNGDGRRDVMVATRGAGNVSSVSRLLAPRLGEETSFTPAARTAGGWWDGRGAGLIDIGDQDGDGVDDVADGRSARLSGGAECWAQGFFVVGSAPDRSGDGRRELVALHADPYSFPTTTGDGFARYWLDTYTTSPLGCPQPAAPPRPFRPVLPPRVAAPRAKHQFVGTAKADILTGTPQHDRLRGMGGDDVLRALAGDDVVEGGAGRDRLDGGPGADTMSGGPGRDVIDGGAGADVISARDGEVDTIRCGPGVDWVTADREDKVSRCEHVSRPAKKKAKKKAKHHR